MDSFTLHGTPPVEILLRRSARARRLSLRVSRIDGRVTLTLPAGVPARTARAFAAERADWLRGHLARTPSRIVPGPGLSLPFEGRETPVEAGGTGRAVRHAGGALCVPGRAEDAPARLGAFLKAAARDRLAAAVDRHASALGRRPARITLRDPRSRWGSCSAAGGLMFSWRLVMAPPEVLDYVAAHEVAHLAEMNHSPAFWAVVAGLCPGYAAPRAWLRAEGAGLHRYDFAPA
jgi:predicted metal-dependent hydrolase